MLDGDENSGIFTFLVGMIVLVMVAVGFSLVLDKRFKFSSRAEELRAEVEMQGADLKELSATHDHLSETLARSTTNRQNDSQEHSGVAVALDTQRKRQEALREEKAALESGIAFVEKDFSVYRANYRSRTWSRAVGEDLGNLTIRGGREYKASRINKVTDVGLEISHEHGIARIQAPDLPATMQDRFQWNDEERRQRLKEEAERLAGRTKPSLAQNDDDAGDPPVEKDPEAPLQPVLNRQERLDQRAALRAEKKEAREREQEKVSNLREQVVKWRAKVGRLASERSEAASNAASSSSTSVHGRLETWRDKSARLGNELAKARIELELAKGRLKVASPSDLELTRDKQR